MFLPNIAARGLRKALAPYLPAPWRLPFEYYLYRSGANCEPELKWLEAICLRRALAVDVGANVGVYAYKMARLFRRVYCFEINPDLTGPLESLRSKHVSVIAKGLSAAPGNLTLHIPVVNRIPLTGWASLQPGNCPDTNTHVEKLVEVTTLDAYELPELSLIKIDVEGHELAVLRGAARTLAKHRPVVIAEVKEPNRAAVARFFANHDYRQLKLEDLVGVAGSPENFIYLPN
jgi:FkbM family methyltransferase